MEKAISNKILFRHRRSLAGFFLFIVVLQVLLAAFSIEIMSSVRGYVAGESLYSKAQKDGLLSLKSYIESNVDADYQEFVSRLKVIEGDAQARLALQQKTVDWQLARDGFLAGENHGDDLDGMIRLFLWGKNIPFMKRAINTWAEGDAAMEELHSLAKAARTDILQGTPDAASVQHLKLRLPEMNKLLSLLQRNFSEELRQGSVLVRRVLLGLNAAIAALIAAMGTFYIRRSLQAQLQIQAEVAEILNAVSEAVISVDSSGRVIVFNTAAEQLFGYSASSAKGLPLDQFIPSGLSKLTLESEADSKQFLCELKGLHGEDRTLYLEVSHATFQTLSGTRTTLVCRDVSQQHTVRTRERSELLKTNAELTNKAYADSLTGLPNREALSRHLNDTFDVCQQSGLPFAVLFLDLDGFKHVNDTHGHLCGDDLLKQFSSRLCQAIREQDKAFRVSGDEFVVIVPTEREGTIGESVAQRVLSVVRQPYCLGEVTVTVTASAGIANYPVDGIDARSLLLAADEAMYRAKKAGKNAYHIHARPFS